VSRRREVQIERAKREVEHAEKEKVKLVRSIENMQAKYVEKLNAGDDKRAEAVLDMLTAGRDKLDSLEARLGAARAALEAVSAEPNLDSALDFMNGLRKELRGAVERAAGDAKRLPEVVRSNFDSVYLRHMDDGSIEIGPVLAREAVERILGRKWVERREALGVPPTMQELSEMTPEQAESKMDEWEWMLEPYLEP
jgi:hypothetical protein